MPKSLIWLTEQFFKTSDVLETSDVWETW